MPIGTGVRVSLFAVMLVMSFFVVIILAVGVVRCEPVFSCGVKKVKGDKFSQGGSTCLLHNTLICMIGCCPGVQKHPTNVWTNRSLKTRVQGPTIYTGIDGAVDGFINPQLTYSQLTAFMYIPRTASLVQNLNQTRWKITSNCPPFR